MHQIIEPTLILNTEICKANVNKMAMRIKKSGGVFRPHFKTHQSATVGNWFIDEGVDCITVSSFQMASYFQQNGWKDITVALSANSIHANVINELASNINLNILLEDEASVIKLEKEISNPVGVYIKVDTGYHRTGIDALELGEIKKLLSILEHSKNLIFIGFLTHAGNTYNARSKDEIQQISKKSMDKMLALKAFLKDSFPLMQLSWGDTPSCSVYDDFYGIDEFRPGNFVFYDYMQSQIGSCTLNDIAVCLAAPVLAVHQSRNEIVVHGGAIHLSKDRVQLKDGTDSYGKVVVFNGDTWNVDKVIGEVKVLSQEHGVISVEKEYEGKIIPGDIVGILPVHSCLTANLMKRFFTQDGNLIEMMQ